MSIDSVASWIKEKASDLWSWIKDNASVRNVLIIAAVIALIVFIAPYTARAVKQKKLTAQTQKLERQITKQDEKIKAQEEKIEMKTEELATLQKANDKKTEEITREAYKKKQNYRDIDVYDYYDTFIADVKARNRSREKHAD